MAARYPAYSRKNLGVAGVNHGSTMLLANDANNAIDPRNPPVSKSTKPENKNPEPIRNAQTVTQKKTS